MNIDILVRIVLYIYVFHVSEVQSISDSKLLMINDTINIYKRPVSVTAFFCNKFESVNLMKMLSHKGIASSIHSPGIHSIPNLFPPNHALLIIDLQCNHTFEFLLQANEENLFSSPYRWFLINHNADLTEITALLTKFKILVDSDVTLTHWNENSFDLVKVYKLEQTGSLVKEKFGCWNIENSLVAKEWKLIERKRLGKIVLNTSIVILHNDTLNHLIDYKYRHIDTISKLSYILLQHLSDILNVTYKYIVQNTWGYKINDYDWNGMTGDLQRKDAVIGGTVGFVKADRIPIVDYVGMTIPTRSKFIFRQPKLSYIQNVYILPFNWKVWISVCGLVLFIIVALYCATKWEWTRSKRDTVNTKLSLVDSVLVAFGAVCQQGSSTVPSNASGRIITILMLISLMFIYTAYSANIVALLQSSSNSIRSLSDLLYSPLSVGVDDNTFNRFYFQNATEPIRKAIYERKVAPPKQNPNFFSVKEGINLMRNGHFAFHVETGVGYKFILETFEEHEKCGLSEIQFLQVSDPALAIQKNSSYKKLIKIGYINANTRSWSAIKRSVFVVYKKPTCVNRATAVAFSGIMLSLTILLLEVVFYQMHKN